MPSAEQRTLEAPADLTAALAGNEAAKAAYERSAYSHRKAYVDWIEEAKRPETRARRVAKAVEMLAAGRPQS